MLEIDIEKRIVNGAWEGYIGRVNRQSIRVFTGKRMSGVELTNFFASGSLDNTKLKVYGPDGPIYLTYESIDISSPGSVAAYSPRVFVEERTLERFIDNFDQYVEGSSGVAKAAAQEALDAKDQLTTDVGQAINELNEVKESNRKRYLDPVATVAERDSAYPTPQNGDSVWVSGEGKMYRYNGTEWKVTNENDPSAIDMVNQQLADTAKRFQGGVVSINEYGDVVNGMDISQLAIDAVNDLLTRFGGGTVLYPRGTFIAQGIPARNGVNHVGTGQYSTKLKLPSSPSDHMFVSVAEELQGGGIYDMELEGSHTGTTYNGIDLGNITTGFAYYIRDNYVHHFNRGVNSTRNDRQVLVEGNRFWSNDIGYYVKFNHPTFGINDFRLNRIGLGGETLYDMQMSGSRFVRNQYGIKADIFMASHIDNVFFFKNTKGGLEVDQDVNIQSCLFVPDGVEDFGILIKHQHVTFVGNTFRKESDSPVYGDAAVVIGGVSPSFGILSDNNFEVDGKAIAFRFTGEYRQSAIDDNMFVGKNVHVTAEDETREIKNCSFNNNKFYLPGETNMTNAVLNIPHSVYGNNFIGNQFVARPGATVGAAMRIDARYGNIAFNRQSAMFAPIEKVNSNASTIEQFNSTYA